MPAAGLAAQRRTPEHLERLRSSLFDPRTVDRERIFAVDRSFHVALLQAANNPLLEVVAQPVFRVLHDRFLRAQAPGRFWHRVDGDHREILRCVEVRDAAGAREAAQVHLGHPRRTYQRIARDRRRVAGADHRR